MRHDDDKQRQDQPPLGAPVPRSNYSIHLLLLTAAVFFLARIPLVPHRIFDPDEFEHSHAAWCLFKGMVPYKDFFEHHTPWYYYTLRPFFNWFDVDASFESARHFLLLGRSLSFALTLLSAVLVFRMGRLWDDRRVDVVAGLFLVGQPVFLQKTLEMRPDVLALPFFLGGLCWLLRGLAISTDSEKRRIWCFLGGGLSLGAGIMCTQKILFVLPGMLAGLGIWSLSARAQTNSRSRILLVLIFLLAAGVPGTLTWAMFASKHAGREFIANNFLLNAHWKHVVTRQFGEFVKTSRPVLALGVVGLVVAARRFFRSPQRDQGEVLLSCTVLGLFAGVPIIPTAQMQYYLMPLPLVCLFAARGLLSLVDLARGRFRAWLLILSMIPLSILPLRALRRSFASRNDRQLERLRYVFDNTKPTDLVMDGWEGTGVFRPHAFYYFFVHDELLPMLSRDRVDGYLDDLESGKIRPRLIALDQHLVALGPRFLAFVRRNYESRDGFLYFSRD